MQCLRDVFAPSIQKLGMASVAFLLRPWTILLDDPSELAYCSSGDGGWLVSDCAHPNSPAHPGVRQDALLPQEHRQTELVRPGACNIDLGDGIGTKFSLRVGRAKETHSLHLYPSRVRPGAKDDTDAIPFSTLDRSF